jgi:hypothetical protein
MPNVAYNPNSYNQPQPGQSVAQQSSSSNSPYASTTNPTYNLQNPTYGIGTASPGTNTAITGLLANLQPTAPTVDPRYAALQGTDINLANSYSQESPELVQEAYNSAADTAAHGLAQANTATMGNYNSRGLAYSGLEQGGEADNATNAANGLATTMEGLNSQAYNNQNTLDTNAMQPGFGIAGLGNNAYTSTTANEQAQAAQSEQQAQLASQAYGSIGAGVGSVAGMGLQGYLSGGNNNMYYSQPTTNTPTNYSAGLGYQPEEGEMTYAGYMPSQWGAYTGTYAGTNAANSGYGGG